MHGVPAGWCCDLAAELEQSSGQRRATPAVNDAGKGARVRGPECLGIGGTTWTCVRPLF